MSRSLAEFIHEFVRPLLSGGTVQIQKPIRPFDLRQMVGEMHKLGALQTELRLLRLRRAQLLIADPLLPEVDEDELALWVGLHNVLALDHPERHRVWARSATWKRAENATRTMLTLGQSDQVDKILVRHLSVGAFIELVREDHHLISPQGEERLLGQPITTRYLRMNSFQFGYQSEIVQWWTTKHSPETERLLSDVLWPSTLTCLLHPQLAPPGWTPLQVAPVLHQRDFARAVCYVWAGSQDWLQIGAAVTSALLHSLGFQLLASGEIRPIELAFEPETSSRQAMLALPGDSYSTKPGDIAVVIAALIHLHFLRVLGLGARLGGIDATRESAVQAFLALPMLLLEMGEELGYPMAMTDENARFNHHIHRRWLEYMEHLDEFISAKLNANLRKLLLPLIFQTSPP